MIVNAVVHRDYSIQGTDIQIKIFDDHYDVESPGFLPGTVRPSNIRSTHFLRNPKIAHYMKAYKYVKEFGEGVDRMCREMEEAGLPDPKYIQQDFILLARLQKKVLDIATTEKTTEKILIALRNAPELTNRELSEICGITEDGIYYNIQKLKKEGKIRRIGGKKSGYWEVLDK